MYPLTTIIISFLVSFAVSCIAIPKVVKLCKQNNLYDLPNSRKVHKNRIPRLGGVVFMPTTMIGITIAMLLQNGDFGGDIVFHKSSFLIMTGAFLLYFIGILDDIQGLKANHKFIIQLVAASIFATINLRIKNLEGLLGLYDLPLIASWLLSVLVIMLIVNAINLIDGIDGLASGLSLIILTVFSFIFYGLEDGFVITLLAVSLAGAVASFFIYNFFGKEGKNKVFMGDTGSLFIGYVVAYLAIKNLVMHKESPASASAMLLSFSLLFIPCIDLVRVALERKANHLPMFQPDKRHIHHIIMASGFSMHTTLFIIMAMAVGFIAMNYALHVSALNLTAIFLLDISLYLIITSIIKKYKKPTATNQ